MIHVISTSFFERTFPAGDGQKWEARCKDSVAAQSMPCEHHYFNAFTLEPSPMLSLLHRVAMSLHPADIIVSLDGDDWFTHEHALATVVEEYNNGTWMTYGQFRHFPDKRPGWASEYDRSIVENGAYRTDVWRATHLKTYRAGLFQRIPLNYLQEEYGPALDTRYRWFTRATDMAVMFACLEMARERAHFISETLVDYNTQNPLSSHNCPSIVTEEIRQTLAIRAMKPLPRLEKAPW